MKRTLHSWLVLAMTLVAMPLPSLATEPAARTHPLEWDHWLWMARIAHRDPDYAPKDFDPADRRIRLCEFRSAREAYERCGIILGEGESILYSAETTQMITRLGAPNFERLQKVHRTMAAWKAGKVREWFLD